MGLLAGGPWNASHASCERKVVVIPNHGRLGNQLFQFAVCYALALENGLCLKPNPAVCHAFALSGPWVGCHGSPRAPQQRRLKPPAAWWGAEDRKAVRRAVAAARGLSVADLSRGADAADNDDDFSCGCAGFDLGASRA